MKLLYCHVDFLDKGGNKKEFRGLEQIDLNLSATHVFSCDGSDSREGHILHGRLRNKPLPENFWSNGDTETNLYNVSVVAGKNGSGKSTVINYLIDLLYYIYLDFGRQTTNIPDSARFDVSLHYNLLVFEEANSLYVVELKPHEQKQRVKCESDELLKTKAVYVIQGKDDHSSAAKKFKRLFQGMKVVYMMNNPTQRDYERNLQRQDGGLRNYFVYDCSLGANMGGQMAQFFPYEVYKQVRYLFDPNQAKIREKIEKRIQPKQKETGKGSKKKPDELVMPRALRLRPRIKMLEDGLIQPLTPSFPTDPENASLPGKCDLAEILGELCCRAFAENAARAFYTDEKEAVNTASKLLYKPAAKDGSLFDEQKHCVHAVANAVTNERNERIEESLVSCCAVLPDGRIVSGSGDTTIRIWNADTGECLRTLEGHDRRVNCLAALPDGRVVSGSYDNTLRIWNADSGECLRTLTGHTDWVNCLAALPDGRLVSGSEDRTIRIWDADTGECLRTLKGHTDRVECLAALPDGRVVRGR